jgi:hypothetical protein
VRISHSGVKAGIPMTPFAIDLYDRFRKGESIEQLASELRIPVERIEQRIRAAARYFEQRPVA